MAQTSVLADRVNRIASGVDARIDRLSEALQPARPKQVSEAEYMPKALAMAEQDPAFRARLEDAMRQYRAAGQGGK